MFEADQPIRGRIALATSGIDFARETIPREERAGSEGHGVGDRRPAPRTRRRDRLHPCGIPPRWKRVGGARSRAPDRAWNPPDSSSVRKHFHAVCARAKVESRRIHDWRATVASWLADLNVHDDTARQVLRHSESNTTIDYYTKTMGYYTKSSSETRRAAIQALDQLFNG